MNNKMDTRGVCDVSGVWCPERVRLYPYDGHPLLIVAPVVLEVWIEYKSSAPLDWSDDKVWSKYLKCRAEVGGGVHHFCTGLASVADGKQGGDEATVSEVRGGEDGEADDYYEDGGTTGC